MFCWVLFLQLGVHSSNCSCCIYHLNILVGHTPKQFVCLELVNAKRASQLCPWYTITDNVTSALTLAENQCCIHLTHLKLLKVIISSRNNAKPTGSSSSFTQDHIEKAMFDLSNITVCWFLLSTDSSIIWIGHQEKKGSWEAQQVHMQSFQTRVGNGLSAQHPGSGSQAWWQAAMQQ